MDELTPPDERGRGADDTAAGERAAGEPGATGPGAFDRGGAGAGAGPGAATGAPDRRADRDDGRDTGSSGREDLVFARVLGVLGMGILLLSGLLLALPSYLSGGPAVYLVAYGIAILFGPVGFWLLGEAWRIRNRALHGTALPPGQRRSLRILGAVLIVIGVFVAFSGFGASGTISTVLNLIWGLSLAGYGVRMLLRSLATERA